VTVLARRKHQTSRAGPPSSIWPKRELRPLLKEGKRVNVTRSERLILNLDPDRRNRMAQLPPPVGGHRVANLSQLTDSKQSQIH
jgi:hypothetical protein